MSTLLAFTVEGHAPRTKKGHNRVVRAGNFTKVLPSKAHEDWFNAVLLDTKVRARRACSIPLPIDHPVNVRAIFYRDKNVGDACNYYEALADLLEAARIVTNDRLIESWDGSRLRKDAQRPRIEVFIEPAE